MTTTEQTIDGTKTFNNTINASITGNAGTVTNGIYTTSSVTDLSDISSSGSGQIITSAERTKLTNFNTSDLNGSIANDKLVNDSITIDGTSVALGGSINTSNTTYSSGNGINLSGTEFTVAGGDGLTQENSGLKITPSQTTVTSVYNSSLKIGTATDQEYINFGTSNEINTYINNKERLSVTNTGVDITGNLNVSGNISGVYSGRIVSKSYISGTTQNYMLLGTTYKHMFGGNGINSLGSQVLEVEFTAGTTHGYLEYGLFLNSSTAGQIVHMGVTAVTGANHIYDVTAGSNTYDARKQGLMDGATTNVSLIELVDLDNHENFFQSGRFHFENLNVGTTYKMGLYARTHSSGTIILNSGGQYTSTSSSLTRNSHHECYLKFIETFSSVVNNNDNGGSGK